MARKFEVLKRWPEVSGRRRLGGKLAGSWRVRTGNYRIRFRVEGERLTIEKVGHREGFYED